MEKLRTDVEAAERRFEEFRETTSIVSEEDETLLAEQIYSLNRAQIDAQLELDTANERLDRLEAAMSARGSTVAFDGVESAVIDELRLEEMRLRQTESQLRSEEHTSELQYLMRNSYAVFCLKKKNTNK